LNLTKTAPLRSDHPVDLVQSVTPYRSIQLRAGVSEMPVEKDDEQ
jgi:hypothetical protein